MVLHDFWSSLLRNSVLGLVPIEILAHTLADVAHAVADTGHDGPRSLTGALDDLAGSTDSPTGDIA